MEGVLSQSKTRTSYSEAIYGFSAFLLINMRLIFGTEVQPKEQDVSDIGVVVNTYA